MFHSTSFSRSGCLPDRRSHYSYSCNTIFLHPPPEEDVRIDQSWEEMASMNLGRNLQQPLPYIPPPPVRPPPTSRALEDTTARHCYFRPGVLPDGRIRDQYAGSSSFYSGGAAVAAARTTRVEGAGVRVGAGAARRSITYPLLEQSQRSEQARRYHHHYHHQQQHPPPLLLHSTSQNPSTNPLFHYPQSDTYAPRTTTRRRRRRRDRHPRKEEQQQQPFYNDNYDDDLHSTFSQINPTHSGYSSSNYNSSNNNDKTTEEEEEEDEEVEEEEEEVEEEPRRGRTRTRTRWGEEEEKKSSPSPSVSRGGGVMIGRGTVTTAVEPVGGYYYETRVVEPEWTR